MWDAIQVGIPMWITPAIFSHLCNVVNMWEKVVEILLGDKTTLLSEK